MSDDGVGIDHDLSTGRQTHRGDQLMVDSRRINFRNFNGYIYSDADGRLIVVGEDRTTIGVPGDIELGDGTLRAMFPNTDEKEDLGIPSKRFRRLFVSQGVFVGVETVTSDPPLDGSDLVVLCDASGGAFTVTLPALAANIGRRFYIKKIDATANAVTIDGNGAETIDDALTRVLAAQYDAVELVGEPSGWWII